MYREATEGKAKDDETKDHEEKMKCERRLSDQQVKYQWFFEGMGRLKSDLVTQTVAYAKSINGLGRAPDIKLAQPKCSVDLPITKTFYRNIPKRNLAAVYANLALLHSRCLWKEQPPDVAKLLKDLKSEQRRQRLRRTGYREFFEG